MMLYPLNGCCAVHEITSLREAGKTGEEAMRNFTHQLWGRNSYASQAQVGAFYIFTGVHRYSKEMKMKAPTYTQNFASFIRENGLGAVTASVIRRNRGIHPEHFDRVYVWAPNEVKLRAWWEADTAEQKKQAEVRKEKQKAAKEAVANAK